MAAAGKEDAGADPASNQRTVGVCFCESTPLLWRAGDVKTARQTGVVGTMVGSLARQPRQNCRLGRPLELLREEAQLLADAGRAVLLSSSRPKVGNSSWKLSPAVWEPQQRGCPVIDA